MTPGEGADFVEEVIALDRGTRPRRTSGRDPRGGRARLSASARRGRSASHRRTPDLVPGEQWPVDADGVPFTFVAQFECSQLPPLTGEFLSPAWPHGRRLIRLFSAFDSDDGAPCPAAALACFPDAPLLRSEAGPALHEVRVQATPFLTAQQSWHVFGDGFHEDYDAFSFRRRRLARRRHPPRGPGRGALRPALDGHFHGLAESSERSSARLRLREVVLPAGPTKVAESSIGSTLRDDRRPWSWFARDGSGRAAVP